MTPHSIYITPLLELNLSHFCILRASSIICRSLSTLYVFTSRASGRTRRPELPSTMFGVLLNCHYHLSALKCPKNFMEWKNKCWDNPYLPFLFLWGHPHIQCAEQTLPIRVVTIANPRAWIWNICAGKVEYYLTQQRKDLIWRIYSGETYGTEGLKCALFIAASGKHVRCEGWMERQMYKGDKNLLHAYENQWMTGWIREGWCDGSCMD